MGAGQSTDSSPSPSAAGSTTGSASKPAPMFDAEGHPIGPDGKRLKPCCVCLDTKQVRDECIMRNGEENCRHLIEAHKQCMRDLGFKI